MLAAPMGQLTELRAPKVTRAVLLGHCPSGPGLLGILARELPLGGGPLPSALICAEMSGRRVWEPARKRAGGWKSPGSASSRRGCCFSQRRVVWAGPPCAIYPALPEPGRRPAQQVLVRCPVGAGSAPRSPRVLGAELGGRKVCCLPHGLQALWDPAGPFSPPLVGAPALGSLGVNLVLWSWRLAAGTGEAFERPCEAPLPGKSPQ